MTCERGRARPCAGFTYIGLLLAVALLGTLTVMAASHWHVQSQRDKEQELLFVGNELRQAIASYAAAAKDKARPFPLSLEDLLRDDRSVELRRHLRRIYADPITGRAEWGLVRLANGQIIGVHSLAEGLPVKQAGFRPRDQGFAGKSKYSEWLFLASGSAVRLPSTTPPPRRPVPGGVSLK
jgi:type II secretory pathway pseudopilin PulG